MRVHAYALLVSLIAAATIAACSSSSSSSSPAFDCPDLLPSACPTPMPSYANEVRAIIQNRCLMCHDPGGIGGIDLSTYKNAFDHAAAMLDQVNACEMPTNGAPQPTDDERVALLGWLVCGAPNN